MQYRPDIVISDRFGAAIAIVEVKALNGAGVQTATRYLRNLLVHGLAPHTGYVLLVTPDRGYLWRRPEDVLHESPPALTFPMDRITRHYLPPDNGTTPVRDLVLEAIVQQWLSDLADGIVVDDEVTASLREVGFLSAVRDGLVDAYARA
jgi:hypothetical protein